MERKLTIYTSEGHTKEERMLEEKGMMLSAQRKIGKLATVRAS